MSTRSGSPAPVAVVSGIASDAHTWNLLYLQLLLEEYGFRVTNLGACVPTSALVAACLRDRPRLVVIGTVNGHGLIEAPACIRSIRECPALRGVTVVIGGKLSLDGECRARDRQRLLRLGFDRVFTGDDAVSAFERFLAQSARVAG